MAMIVNTVTLVLFAQYLCVTISQQYDKQPILNTYGDNPISNGHENAQNHGQQPLPSSQGYANPPGESYGGSTQQGGENSIQEKTKPAKKNGCPFSQGHQKTIEPPVTKNPSTKKSGCTKGQTAAPLVTQTAKPPVEATQGSCVDNNQFCCYWSALGHCDSNLHWMRPNCQKACGTCGCTVENAPSCKVSLGACTSTTAQPPETSSAETQQPLMPSSEAPPPPATDPASAATAQTAPPQTSAVPVPGPPGSQTSEAHGSTGTGDSRDGACVDSNENCCKWADQGQCDSNLFWMRSNCQKACGTCGCTVETAPSCKVKLGACATLPALPAPVQPEPATLPPAPPATQPPVGPPSPMPETEAPHTESPVLSSEATVTQPPPVETPAPQAPETTPAAECADTSDLCCYWASLGHCDSNLFWMRPHCQKACGTCGCTIDDAPTCKVNLGSCAAATTAPPPPTLPSSPASTESHSEAPTPPPQTGPCVDKNELCCFWASLGHCDSNLFWMRPNCQKACGTCGCTTESALMCKVTLGACTTTASPLPASTPEPHTEPPVVETTPTVVPPTPAETEATPPPIAPTDHIMPPSGPEPTETTPAPTTPASTGPCVDNNQLCCFWASLGHCDSNAIWMRPNCQKACGTCGCTVEKAATCNVLLGACGLPSMPGPPAPQPIIPPVTPSGQPEPSVSQAATPAPQPAPHEKETEQLPNVPYPNYGSLKGYAGENSIDVNGQFMNYQSLAGAAAAGHNENQGSNSQHNLQTIGSSYAQAPVPVVGFKQIY